MVQNLDGTVVELLLVTLFSIYVTISYSCWMPFFNQIPKEIHMVLQFALIALPQSIIILKPELVLKLYSSFLIFAIVGATCSFSRYLYIKKKCVNPSAEDSFDIEKARLICPDASAVRISQYFTCKPENNRLSNTVSCYQSCIMIMTITAISAVDFRTFPKRFRKSSTFGLSLMDIGVALLIMASGLVMSKYLHGPSKLNFRRLFKSTAPLLIFGVVKGFVTAKYQIGAEEYGKHWNFFINLFIFPYTLYIGNVLPSIHLIPVLCTICMTVYQYLLSYADNSSYILKSIGESFYDQNKIGLFSLGGFCCLFLMSCYIGKLYLIRETDPKTSLTGLFLSSVILWSSFTFLYGKYPPSRTLANLAYVIWGLANGSLHALIFSILDTVFPEQYRFLIFTDMISKYRLSSFLLANILSTLIKYFFDVKSKSAEYTMAVVTVYLFLTCSTISLFYFRSIKNTTKLIREQ